MNCFYSNNIHLMVVVNKYFAKECECVNDELIQDTVHNFPSFTVIKDYCDSWYFMR